MRATLLYKINRKMDKSQTFVWNFFRFVTWNIDIYAELLLNLACYADAVSNGGGRESYNVADKQSGAAQIEGKGEKVTYGNI